MRDVSTSNGRFRQLKNTGIDILWRFAQIGGALRVVVTIEVEAAKTKQNVAKHETRRI